MSSKYSIASLPLPSSSHILTHNLTPDPVQPSVYAFYQNLTTKPSAQRRSRMLHPSSHFSYVAPLPLPFPYRIVAPDGEEEVDQTEVVENWLSKREPLEEIPLASPSESKLRKYTAPDGARDQKRILLAVSSTGLKDCLPHLDVGDAFEHVGQGSLSGSSKTDDKPNEARQELIDVLSGHSVLMHIPPSAESEEKGYAPWSLRYSGHQFGTWAGQLGDGRAISLISTPHPDDPSTTYEIQIKGGGRTPFSRGADGLAVLRSSVREFLGAEAVHALGIPSTRSLTLISLPDLPVAREKLEYASIATRLAPSFLRIGNFETFNPPHDILYLFGHGAGGNNKDWEGIRILGEWVVKRVLKLDLAEGEAWGKKMVLDVARRNAEMLGGWQAYGFMHGVMNTDNISLLGLTIDYGPYAFMDVYDYNHICNHSDDGGRYSFRMQPSMIIFAVRALLNAVSPLIGAESSLGHAVGPGWAKDASEDQISEWTKKGQELRGEVEEIIKGVFEKKYWGLVRQRLGLKKDDDRDVQNIFQPLLDVMQHHGLDFHGTYRALCAFRPEHLDVDSADAEAKGKDKSDAYGSVLKELESIDQSPAVSCPMPSGDALVGAQSNAQAQAQSETTFAIPATNGTSTTTPLATLLARITPPDLISPPSRERACRDILGWLEKYAVRIAEDDVTWTPEEREQAMKGANPRFVLRQWVLEEVIAAVDKDPVGGRGVLMKTLEMATNPFKPWGAEDDSRPESELSEEERAERRFCGVGSQNYLGFQCSCSS